MLKNLPDFLPAGLVKDLRQSFHSPIYLILYGLAMLFIGANYLASSGKYSLGESAMMLQLPLFLLLIPLRASVTVAADTAQTGANFLQMTALSSRSLAWGVMLSSLLQILVTALIIAVFLTALSLTPQQRDLMDFWKYLGGCAMGSALMTGFLMVTARVSLIFRLGFAFPLMVLLVGCFVQLLMLPEGIDSGARWLFATLNLIVLLAMLVELVRRAYASPAENTVCGVRILMLFPLLFFVVAKLAGVEPDLVKMQLQISCCSAMALSTLEAALPAIELPERRIRQGWWRWLATIKEKSVRGSVLYLWVVGLAILACLLWLLSQGSRISDFLPLTGSSLIYCLPGSLAERWEFSAVIAFPIRWIFSVLVSLVLLDIFCKCSNPNRFVQFVIITVALVLLGAFFGFAGLTTLWPYTCLFDGGISLVSEGDAERSLEMIITMNYIALILSILMTVTLFLRKRRVS